MPSLQYLPPQFLLPWLAPTLLRRGRYFHASSPRPQSPPTADQPPPIEKSLLEELFPENALDHGPRPQTQHRDVPPLPLPDHLHPPNAKHRPDRRFVRRVTTTTSSIELYVKSGRSQTAAPVQVPAKSPANALGLLVVQSASPSLCEADFRRLVPSGHHLPGWKGEGDILKVIPGRNPQTLDPAPFYYLLFSSPSSARAYRENALRLHLLARTHTSQRSSSLVTPPPGMMVEGKDVWKEIQRYSLVPVTQTLGLKVLDGTWTRGVRAVVEAGGYKGLVGKERKLVRVWVEGGPVKTEDLKSLIDSDGSSDGRARSWGLRGGCHGGVQELGGVEGDAVEPDSGEGWEDEDRAETRRGKERRKWLLEFEEEVESRRFVRSWHRREWPGKGEDGGSLVWNAELIW